MPATGFNSELLTLVFALAFLVRVYESRRVLGFAVLLDVRVAVLLGRVLAFAFRIATHALHCQLI